MSGPRSIETARILEIGDGFHFKREYPERTTLLWSSQKLLGPQLLDAHSTPGRLMAELKAAAEGRYDVIVAYPPRYTPWHPRHWARALGREPWRPWSALTRAFGVPLLRFQRLPVPLVAIDMDDSFNLSRSSLFLLDKADVFLKRELPVDRWLALTGPVHRHIATLRYRRSPRWVQRINKLQPITLPQEAVPAALTHAAPPEKTADLFFAGGVEANATVRTDGIAEIEQLKARGIVVDYPRTPVAREEYLRRMASAWLAWSPGGRGWQCYRHYESALVQTVPVMNYPNVLRHAPLEEGVHAFHYGPEAGGLERAVLAALTDKERLRRMAAAARDHALAHHTRKAYCDHILRLALDTRG